ncbi:MAG: hypothetical protein KKF46_00345 [Nanoarchaeota archaeon]|nr:hypothetical protein [Nanoarchaeota archaeon]MBU1320783.1 hypothetical protein [Nanoarchaeota archaeon]MBU1598150.1 hypothetical protein [Nanoarchaeota archaeon]MBU2442211.1 hypothetical protein [Nanoarchaeota archaeon]
MSTNEIKKAEKEAILLARGICFDIITERHKYPFLTRNQKNSYECNNYTYIERNEFLEELKKRNISFYLDHSQLKSSSILDLSMIVYKDLIKENQLPEKVELKTSSGDLLLSQTIDYDNFFLNMGFRILLSDYKKIMPILDNRSAELLEKHDFLEDKIRGCCFSSYYLGMILYFLGDKRSPEIAISDYYKEKGYDFSIETFRGEYVEIKRWNHIPKNIINDSLFKLRFSISPEIFGIHEYESTRVNMSMGKPCSNFVLYDDGVFKEKPLSRFEFTHPITKGSFKDPVKARDILRLAASYCQFTTP